jgi:hypothetical protein
LLTPGSKWFLTSIGHEGLNNLLAAYPDKSAKAVCTFAYSPGPGHEPILFQGITEGKIVPARGPSNFGMSIPSSNILQLRSSISDTCNLLARLGSDL